ncbi:MAG: hypothetical protein LBT33_08870 [Spirochaetia bacterium]|nr:hypothetical protein [Spirochaetia bacterium]
MRDTITALISLLLKTALFFLCIMLVVVLSPSPRFPGAMPPAEYFLQRISLWGNESLVAAVFLALVATHFRIIRKTGKKPLSFSLVLLCAFCLLYFGLFGLGRLFPGFEASTQPAAVYLEKNLIEHSGAAFIWSGHGDAGAQEDFSKAGPLVVLDTGKSGGSFQVYPEAVFDAKTKALKIAGREDLPLHDEGPVYVSPFMRFFINDLEHLCALLRPGSLLDIKALCAVFSFVFFGFSLWALAKLSRWPFFNLWFTLAFSWIALEGLRALDLYVVPEIARFETLAWAAGFLPVAFLGLCGLLLFIVGLLGRPLEEWKREMRYE